MIPEPAGRGRPRLSRRGLVPSLTVPQRLEPLWIDDASGVVQVAEAARAAGRFSLDTEADSLHSYFHKVCLIQVTAGGRHFLVDPLALQDGDLAPLLELVEDPGIPVLMHGADYDIRVLDRDHGARVRGLEDTQIMAQLLGEPRTGLAALLEAELGIVLDKKHQRADWGRRPLPPEMLTYAAADTAFLEELAGKLRRRLEALDRWEWAREEFRRLEGVRHTVVEHDPLAFERVKGVRRLRGIERDRAFSLYWWRDETARRLDVPPFRVLGNAQLLLLATTAPATLEEIAAVSGLGPRFARRWGHEVLELLRRPRRAPQRERRTGGAAPLTAEERRRLKALAAERDAVAAELGLDPGLLCPRATLERLALCSEAPRDPGACGLSGWRLEVLGERLAAALEGTGAE